MVDFFIKFYSASTGIRPSWYTQIGMKPFLDKILTKYLTKILTNPPILVPSIILEMVGSL